MFYDRQIKYLDVYEKGEKVQNAGFVRLEAREDKVNIQLRAEKLRHTDTCKVQVMLMNENKEAMLGELILDKGSGMLEYRGLKLQDMAGGIGYEDLCEICLKLPGERVLRCIIRERKPIALEAATITEDEVMSEAVIFQAPFQEEGNISEQMPPLAPQPLFMPEKRKPEEQERNGMESEAALQEVLPEAEVSKPEGEPEEQEQSFYKPELQLNTPGPVLRPIPMPPVQERPNATTKWQQLSNVFPHIRPFEDGRDYLKIKPEDFIVLTKKYYSLTTNSFLKHGYYNYEHLILTREMRKDGEQFYIGVPGNFYDKEKQVAVLFGFESFEGRIEPAKSGDFGYYMIPVEI